jgi:RNA polymerase sigma-70 factor (ECF subfamily)
MPDFKIDKNKLVEQFGMKISRLSCRMIQNNELAQEAAQEVWYEVIKSIDSFRGDSELSTWIFTIARRTIFKYLATERIYTASEINGHFDREPIDYKGLEDDKHQWVKEQCDFCLTAFCHCLNNESRLIYLFRDIAELPYNQISTIMDMSEENVRKTASRAKAKVRNFMNRNCMLYNPNSNCKCLIKNHVTAVCLDKEYQKLANAAKVVQLYQKFDKELPRKDFWGKFIS